VLRIPSLVGLTGVLLLNAGGVGQHEPGEILCAWRAEDAPAIPLGDEPRQISDVVKVGVRENHRVYRGRRDGKFLPVPEPKLFEALKEPAVDEYPFALEIEKISGSRHRPRSAEEGQ
jgi:hypothetical protein